MGSQWEARGAPLLETVKQQLKNKTAIEEALNAQLEAAWPQQDGGWLAKTKNSAARLVGRGATKLVAKLVTSIDVDVASAELLKAVGAELDKASVDYNGEKINLAHVRRDYEAYAKTRRKAGADL